MNAAQVVEKLSKAIQAAEAWHEAQRQCPKEAAGATEFFLKCYPNRAQLIAGLAAPQKGTATLDGH